MIVARAVCLASLVVGFSHVGVPPRQLSRRASSAYDEAVTAAEKASEEFGTQSVEAKAAWEAVEEMNWSTEESDAAKEVDPEVLAAKLDELKSLLSTSMPAVENFKVELSKISGAALVGSSPAVADASADVDELTKAAEAATAEFGPESPEAKSAWEAVEEMNDSTNVMIAAIPGLDETCVTDAVEKCIAFEEAMASLESAVSALNA